MFGTLVLIKLLGIKINNKNHQYIEPKTYTAFYNYFYLHFPILVYKCI